MKTYISEFLSCEGASEILEYIALVMAAVLLMGIVKKLGETSKGKIEEAAQHIG